MDKKLKVLVIGANGSMGRFLVPLLLSNGHHVRAFDRSPLSWDCERLQGSTSDYSFLEKAAEGMDVIVNSAGIHLHKDEPDKYEEHLETNIMGTFHVFLAAVRKNVPKVIHMSSHAVYQRG